MCVCIYILGNVHAPYTNRLILRTYSTMQSVHFNGMVNDEHICTISLTFMTFCSPLLRSILGEHNESRFCTERPTCLFTINQ